jgi:GTPase SAR1 family protein
MFMDVEFASKTHVHKVIETHFDQTLELSWPEYPGASNYIICAEEDHYPFEIRQSSALANVETTRAEVPDHLSYFTVFAFTPQSPKGVPWARGRFVTDIQWLTAEALENSAALRWPQIAAGATLRVCRSLPDQPLPEIPSANYWLPIDAATRSYVDTGISLGKKYQYRAYLEWDGVDGAIHSTMGKSVSLLALFEFPEIQQFTAGLDADVSGVVQCQVLGKVTSDNVRIFEIEELPSPELLAAVADKAQLPTEELDRIDQRSWLGQPLLANYQNVASGVLATSQLVNSKTITKTFVLVIVLGSIAQVTSLVSIQQIGAIHSAELIDRFDYQVIRIPEPIGAQSFDIWIVAQSVPFSHVAHTPPSRRIIVQDEYLRYGGILFADNVPDRPQVRKLTSHKQTIYIRGAASFDGETEFGPVVQIDYPGRIELHYGITDPPEPAKAKKAKKYRWWKFWLWKQRPKKKKNVATNEAKGEALAAAPETNATVDRIGNALLGQSKSEVKPDVIDSSVLEKFLGGLRNIGIWPKAKHENPTDPSNLLLLKVEGLDASQQLKELSVMHFAGSVLPIDEHDAEVSKTPISLEITDYERAFQPYKLNTNEAKAEDPGLLLEKSLRHRLQVQCDPFTDLLHGYRCFSIDDGTPLQNKPRSAAESAELELTVAVVGAPKSGKSTYLAALMNYLEQQYELLVDAEVRDIAGEDSLRTITKQLAQGGKLPRSGRPITGNGDSPVSHLEFASRSPIPMRKLNLIDTSGLNLAEPAALKMAESALLDSDLLIITIDPTQNPAVTELLTGLVNRNAEREDPDQPFWVLESIVSFLVENQELRKPGQRIAFVVTKSDSIEIASKSPGTPLAGVIRSGMAMARDPHLLSRANYNQSFGSLLSSETQGVLRRMSRMGPFLKLVKDSFNPEFVRFFSVTALSKTNHSDNLGGLGLTSQRISDPLRWSIESIAADRESDSPDKKPASTQTRK